MRKFLLSLFFSAAALACSAYPLTENGFINRWLVRGPYPSYQTEETANEGGTGFSQDFLAPLYGSEAAAHPAPGLPEKVTFIADEAKLIAGVGATNEWGVRENTVADVEWKERVFKGDVCYGLDSGLAPHDDFIVNYAACYVFSPADREVFLRGGCDDDHKLFLNGVQVGYAVGSSGASEDKFSYRARLRKGLNTVLLKVVDRIADHGLMLGIFDLDGKPLQDVEIFTVSPADEIIAAGKCRSVSSWYRGFYLGRGDDAALMKGGNAGFRICCGCPEPEKYSVTVTVRQNGRNVISVPVHAASGCIDAVVPLDLPEDSDVTVRADFRGVQSNDVIVLDAVYPVFSQEKSEAELQKLRAANTDMNAGLRKAAADLEQARKGGEAAVIALRTEAEVQESAYLAAREVLDAAVGDAGKSENSPLPPAPAGLRKSLCLDTELWRMALGKDGQNPEVYDAPAEPSAWRKEAIPYRASNDYFRTWFFPVRLKEKGKVYGPIENLPGWEDFNYNTWYGEKRIWFEKEVNLDFDPSGMICEYNCGAIWGRVHIFVNREYCGKWDTVIGRATVPLKNLKQGKNLFTIYYEHPSVAGQHFMPYFDMYYGILGQSALDFRPPAPSVFPMIHPSWRKAELEVENEIGVSAADYTLRQYVALDGRVVKTLPETHIPAGAATTSKTAVKWTDAKNWGIGDAAGSPVLYTLVSDIIGSNGEIIDRRTDTFGFREVWTAGHHIYLNGRRIILQGDVGLGARWDRLTVPKQMNIYFGALRSDNINTLRVHDSSYWSEEFLNTCDRLGWYAYVNMYPWMDFPGKDDPSKFYSFEEWMKRPEHADNLKRYRNWAKMLENHPSVIICATDNEVATQAWDTPATLQRNLANEKIAAWYNNYVREITGGRYIMTRDGDVGTWNWQGKWRDEPACQTANFHYPNYEVNDRIFNWPLNFGDPKPLIYGENLYCAYFVNSHWVLPSLEIVRKRANEVRKLVQNVRKWEVPGSVYMGQGADGYVFADDTGKGNPLGVTADMIAGKVQPSYKGYPYVRVNWPALSGPGPRWKFIEVDGKRGNTNFNWADPDRPAYVRSEINDAYRESLIQQPKSASDPRAECVVRVDGGVADVPVTARRIGGVGSTDYITLTDSNGMAYFLFNGPGDYEFTCGGRKVIRHLDAMGGYISKPGFRDTPAVDLK